MNHLKIEDLLEHMETAAKNAVLFIQEMNKDSFLNDKKTQQAVLLNIMIIGEASSIALKKYPEFTESHPNLPWRKMRGMRNRVTHGYFDIDLTAVWNTVQLALPELINEISALKKT